MTIAEASDTPRIFDERGKEIRGNAGPYREGDSPQLTCNVTGGNYKCIFFYTRKKSIPLSTLAKSIFNSFRNLTSVLLCFKFFERNQY